MLISEQKYTIYRKMPMLVARQERTLAIDGVYIHVGSLSTCIIFASDGLNRSCLQQTKQKQYSIVVKRHHIISRVSRIVSNQQLHLPFLNLFWLVGPRANVMISRQRARNMPVGSLSFAAISSNMIIITAEIVQTIKNLKVALERSGTVNRSRRSRHVV